MNDLTMKDTTKDAIKEAVKRTIQVHSSSMNANKKSGELAHVSKACSDRMRLRADSLNTLKNSFNEVRKAIAQTGLYHHLLPNKLKKIDDQLSSIITLSDMKRDCGNDLDLFKAKLFRKSEELKAKSKEKYEKGDKEKAQKLLKLSDEIKNLRVYPESWYGFKLTQSESELTKEKSDETRTEKMTNLVDIGIQSYISLARELMRDEYYVRRSIGLAMLSGRRMSEIFVSAKFEPCGDKLKFSGALKKSLEKTIATDNEHIIDSIIEPSEFVYYFELFREDEEVKKIIEACKESGDYKPVNKKVTTLARYNVKKQFPKLNDKKTDWKFSDSRAMAAPVAYFLDSKKPKNERTEDEVIFYQRYFCHERVEEMLNYRSFSVIPDIEQKTLLERLYDAEEDILTKASISDITTDRFLKVHDSLCNYLAKNPNTTKITRALIKKPKKTGGVGAAHDVAVEYFEIIRKHII